MTSGPPPTAWTPRNTGFDADLFGVIFADDLFVAVGGTDEGLARILISRDGVNWSSRVRGPAPTLLSITHETERRRFVAVGNNGAVMTSPDGISWSRRESGTTHHLTSVTNGNLTFRAVGEQGVALVSNEGTHWFREEIEDFDVRLAAVTFGNHVFVAAGDFGALVATRFGGGKWREQDPGVRPPVWNVALFGNDRFLLAGTDGVVTTSPRGDVWTPGSVGSPIRVAGGTFAEGRFFLVGRDGELARSADGQAWTSSRLSHSFDGFAMGNGIFVAVGGDGIFSSPDGLTWTPRVTDSPRLLGVAFENGTFVATGEQGALLTSSDGIDWTVRNSPTADVLNQVAFGNGAWVAVGGGGAAVTSTDLANWTLHQALPVD